MFRNRENALYWFWCGTISLFLFAIYIQTQLFLHQDVSWLMHAASRMLAGGTYSKNFFDPDPPMILFLYSLPVTLSQLFDVSYMTSLRIFVSGITGIVIFLCYFLTQSLLDRDSLSKPFVLNESHILIVSITIVCLYAPVAAFGQRDHLFVICILPYLLSATIRGENKKGSPIFLAVLTGLLAGLGFSIKPFFMLLFFWIELFLLLITKNLLSWLRIEVIIILGIFAGYFASIPLFFPDYLNEVAPHCYRFFFTGNFLQLRSHPFVADMLLILFITAVLYIRNNPIKILDSILFIAMWGAFFIFLIQGGAFLYYHAYPVIALALLLLSLLYFRLITELYVWLKGPIFYLVMGALAVVIFIFPVIKIAEQMQYYLNEKKQGYRNEIIQFMRSNTAYHSCYFITAFHMAYPMVDYSKIKADSRFYNFASLSILLDELSILKAGPMKSQLQREGEQFFNVITHELKQFKPDIIFVDLITVPGFDEVKRRIFTEPRLNTFWQEYRFVKNVAFYQVYERLSLPDKRA